MFHPLLTCIWRFISVSRGVFSLKKRGENLIFFRFGISGVRNNVIHTSPNFQFNRSSKNCWVLGSVFRDFIPHRGVRRVWRFPGSSGVLVLVVYLIPQYDAHQTRRVQAISRAFSIARVSLSREQNSQTKTPDEHPSSTARGVEIFKHASRLCEEWNLGKRYQVPNKFLSSDWIENLGMCLWRYCADPKFWT